ncbi:MAG: DUF58 domain-containing protein [Thermoanaerobaculia bacterium]|nr:DUF58 domain-containing protein [Thermoanaerobaculia bacterium]
MSRRGGWRPGSKLLRAAVVLAAVVVLLPLVGGGALAALGLAAGLAVLGALVLVDSRSLVQVQPRLERPAKIALSLGEAETVSLRLVAPVRQPLGLVLRQRWPWFLEPPASRIEARLEPGRELDLELPVFARARGEAVLEEPWVALTARGWLERILPVVSETPGGSTLAVLPNLKAVARHHAQLDRLFLRGLGHRVSPRVGKGREFERLRDHVTGDELRDIAWKASARHGKWITREFRLDRSQDILVAIDRGHRMAARVSGLARVDHAVNAAVLVSSIAHRFEDRVGLVSFADGVDSGPAQGRGGSHLRAITGFAAGVEAAYRHTDYPALAAHVRHRLRSRTLVLVVTALPELGEEGSLLRAAGLLLPTHLPLFVVFSDPALEATAKIRPADRSELLRTLVARDLWLARRKTLAELRRRGALVVEALPGDIGVAAVNGYLEVKRRQLL